MNDQTDRPVTDTPSSQTMTRDGKTVLPPKWKEAKPLVESSMDRQLAVERNLNTNRTEELLEGMAEATEGMVENATTLDTNVKELLRIYRGLKNSMRM